jgi:NTE family protein
VGDRMLLDGCLSDPLPVDVAMREGADVILAMGFESPYPSRVRSALRYAFQINSIYTNNLLRANYSFHNLAHHTEIIPILPQFDGRLGLFDTDRIPYVIEQGEREAEAQLPYLIRLLEGVVA